MGVKSVSLKVICVLAAIAVVLAASLVWGGEQAHAASSTVARIEDRYSRVIGRYEDLQAAFDAVEDGQKIYLTKEVKVSKPLVINRGKLFELRLNGHTITNADHELPTYLMIVKNGHVSITGPGCMEGKYSTRCIRLDSGRLSTWASEKTFFRGSRVMDIYGGEAYIDGGTFENSIVVYNPAVKLQIKDGNFEKNANVSAKGENACDMKITGGVFIGKVTNTGKSGFITGGTYHYLRMPNDQYIHPEYTKVEDSITRSGRTEKAYRIVRRPPSVALTPESGTAQYDPAGPGTTVTAKMVDADRTTELKPATYKWYKGDDLIGESQTMTLNEPGTYKAVGTYDGKSYEADYVVKPADISSGYTTSIAASATFTGFPYGKEFVESNAKLFKSGSATPIEGFTFKAVSTGENTDAGTDAGTYTIEGTGKYAGKLSGTFDIGKADFSKVNFTLSPAEATYTGAEIRPAVTGTLTTGDGDKAKTYMLDPSEYTVNYSNNENVGTAKAIVTSTNKNFSGDPHTLNFQIKRATNDVSVSIGDWAWGEKKTPEVTADFDEEKATFAYKAKGAADTTYTSAVPTWPGDYTVKATIEGSNNYEEGVGTADFTIGPIPLTITGATATPRAYETGNKAVEISNVTFMNSKDEPVTLVKGTDYTVSGVMDNADAGDSKKVTVTVTLANDDYSLATTTATTTVAIAKAAAPIIQNVPFLQKVGLKEQYTVSQSLAGKMPSDAGELTYAANGAPTKVGNTFDVSGFSVSNTGDSKGTVTATVTYTDNAGENDQVTLPVKIGSTNYQDATVYVVVSLVVKTILNDNAVTITGAPTKSKTYGDPSFMLTASVTSAASEGGTWTWYSSDTNVLVVTGSGATATVEVVKPGSAMLAAVYENADCIGAAITDPIAVNKRPLTITATSPESIYVGGTVPTLPESPVVDTDYGVEGGVVTGDSLSGVKLAYSSAPDNTKPGTYAIVPSGATVQKEEGGQSVSGNYAINYVNGTFEVKPKEPQTITADDVTVVYGDTGKSVSASVTVPQTGGGDISYAVTSGSDCIDIDKESGALTIKKAGTATVTVTAAETATCAQTTKDVTVTVLKAESKAATVSDPDFGWTYDGTERRLVVVEGEVTGGTMRYSLDGKNFSPSIPTAKNAGDYTVWYKVKGDENHNDSKVQSLDVTVYKADPVVDAPDPLSATCDDLLENVKLPEVEGGTWSWGADPGAVVEHAGANNFDATFTPTDTTNYNTLVGVLVVVNAAKGQSSVTSAPTATNPAYNGDMQALVKAGSAHGGTMVYSLDGEDYVEELSAAAEVGDYTVWYMVAGDEDHNDSEPARTSAKITEASIAKAKVTLEQTSYVYDGQEKKPAVKSVVLDGKTLAEGADYTVSYRDNVKVGTATVTVTGKGGYKDAATAAFTIEAAPEPGPSPEPEPGPEPRRKTAPATWDRLWGETGLDTMATIVGEGGFEPGGTVVLSTFDGYWDALAGAGIAGKLGAPVLMTPAGGLAAQTRSLLESLKPARIVVCGGTAALPDAVADEAAAVSGAEVVRCWGQTAVGTAESIAGEAQRLSGKAWADTAFLCTDDGYWDALAAAPISYAKNMPIFLARGHDAVEGSTADAMRAAGVKSVYIVGGEAAISPAAEQAVRDAGFDVAGRLGGQTAIETSEEVASYGLSLGMTADYMGVATVGGYWDALAGAPLCGKRNSVLVLAGGADSHSISGFIKEHDLSIVSAYVFGGEAAIDKPTYDAIVGASATVPNGGDLSAAQVSF